MNGSKVKITIKKPGGRLDQILSTTVEDLSRTRLQKLIREGKVLVDGVVITKPAYGLEGNEIVEFEIPTPTLTTIKAEPIPLDIIFENQDLIIINKPSGMVVHPSVGHSSGTLVNAVLAHAPELHGIGGEHRPGVVHRLDKDTSGIILMAKNDSAFQLLQMQFSERKVEKTYLALVDEKPPTPSGRIEVAIGRDPQHRQRMAVVTAAKGRDAVSVFRTVEVFDEHTLLEVRPITGRTHQIRLHLGFVGCPVVGDKIYGRKKPTIDIKRQFLHAAKIKIVLPGGDEIVSFEAPFPEDLEKVLVNLRKTR